MTAQPPPRGFFKNGLAWSLVLHVVVGVLPFWGTLAGDSGEHDEMGDGFVVSLVEGDGPLGPVVPERAAIVTPAQAEPEPEPEPEPLQPDPTPASDSLPPPLSPDESVGAPAGADSGGSPGTPPGTRPSGPDSPPGVTAPFHPPRLLGGSIPIDPDDSEEMDVPAEIPVRLRIGTTGRVVAVIPEIEGLPEPVIAALEQAATAMTFIPARRGERPVEAWFSMTFLYRR